MKNTSAFISFILFTAIIFSCTKQGLLSPQPVIEPRLLYINFLQDTVPIRLSITGARKENIGNVFMTAIEGKMPDSILRKNNIIIRVTGDSARAYTNTEILVNYTDSTGNVYANNISDTTNKVTITKLEKKKDGIVEGNFTIQVSNSTKTKILLLKEGKFSTVMSE